MTKTTLSLLLPLCLPSPILPSALETSIAEVSEVTETSQKFLRVDELLVPPCVAPRVPSIFFQNTKYLASISPQNDMEFLPPHRIGLPLQFLLLIRRPIMF